MTHNITVNMVHLTPEELVGVLNMLGVPFLVGPKHSSFSPPPEALLVMLANQPEARLRLAIIPLLLVHPEFAAALPQAKFPLSEGARTTLKCFYTAAMLLQQKHATPLQKLLGERERLPDLFSRELQIPSTGAPNARLQQLAQRHQAISGLVVNWEGTYEHAAKRLIKRLEWEHKWKK